MSTYLWINILAISVPFALSFHPKIRLYKRWSALWPAIILPAILFIVWDMYFTKLGVWGFTATHLSGLKLGNLPIEEVLFFVAIPYACLFTYDVIRQYIKVNINTHLLKDIIFILAIVLLTTGFINADKLYTSTTFILTAIYLLMHIFLFKSDYLNHFFIAYLVIYLFPFLIVNGILTGSFVGDPVVWYNNAENLGLRIFTIPIEDFVYGMLLYLMNVTVYEYFLSDNKVTVKHPSDLKPFQKF